MTMRIPFASILAFPLPGSEDRKLSLEVDPAEDVPISAFASPSFTWHDASHGPLPPPTSHLLCTTTYPAPGVFLPWHYANLTLLEGGCVVWIGCSGLGERHVRQTLRRALASSQSVRSTVYNGTIHHRPVPTPATPSNRLSFLDAVEIMTEEGPFGGGGGNNDGPNGQGQGIAAPYDAHMGLQRLQRQLTEELERIEAERDYRDTVQPAQRGGDGRVSPTTPTKPPVLVVIEDASALAWIIDHLSDDASTTEHTATGPDSVSPLERQGTRATVEDDARIQLLRDKLRKGHTAIHTDVVGDRLGRFIGQCLHQEVCAAKGAILLTHLSADNTSLQAPTSASPPTRGGQYGVGTGFDADDAGEEDEEEELYEEDEGRGGWNASTTDDSAPSSLQAPTMAIAPSASPRAPIAAATIDWRVDSVLRQILQRADVWIEIRGLRSGRARDCDGEVCLYSLGRPCRARNVRLPRLPLPADPLDGLRGQDRIQQNFSAMSLVPDRNVTKGAAGDRPLADGPTLRRWRLQTWCEGREAAMLFRIEADGEAFAWRRGRR